MKRTIAAFLAVLLFLAGFCPAVAETVNLLENGGFETVSDNALPEGWYATAYRNQSGYSRLTASTEQAHSGRYSALVENASSNDARFTCTVKVEPASLYKLSGYVLVESMEDTGNGANFGIEGIYSFSEGLFQPTGEWEYLEWYGETGETQTEVTIGVRVGGYSAESTGKAYFDDIVLEKVDSLPEDVIASLWYSDPAFSSGSGTEETSGEKSTLLFVLLAVLFLLLAAVLSVPVWQRELSFAARVAFGILIVLALGLRIWLAMTVEGYQVDISCFTAWSMRMASVGPVHFYAPDYFCDYPPGAMLLLWPVGVLLNAFGSANSAVSLLIVKLLPILCDLLGAACLLRFGKRHWSSSAAAAAAVLYLLNPAALVNGAAWGQMDSVLALLMLLTTLAAVEECWRRAIPLFVISALVKPQALLFAPLGAAALLIHLFAEKQENRKEVLKQAAHGMLGALIAALVIVVPFAIGQEHPFGWLFDLYGNTLGSYAYATLNTANLYYLAGANWAPLSQNVPAALFIVSAVVMVAAGICLWLDQTGNRLCAGRAKRRQLAVLLFAMSALLLVLFAFGASYAWYGYAMMAFAYAFAILCLVHTAGRGTLPFCMALALAGVYVLGVKIHERYLFPALLLMLLSWLNTRDRRLLWLFAGMSATTFVNTAIVLDNSILFGAEYGHLNPDTQTLNLILCVFNLLLYGYACWIGLSGFQPAKPIPKHRRNETEAKNDRNASYRGMLLEPQDHRLHLTLRDYLMMGITTLAYAVLAFTNLGSTVAPQTAWVSTSQNETVVLELDEPATFSVLYYAGVSYNDFAIAVSDDGINWSESYPCEMREGLCYRWNYALKSTAADGEVSYPTGKPENVLWLTGKYLRIDPIYSGLNLWEIVARNENGVNLPLKVAEHRNARPELLSTSQPASNLVDEQDTCVGEPGWYTGTYFDEIYHARTAYEHLHGQAPYETTHPPLGKLMMSAAISVFGMTPFGWRFAGTLIGVLMVPALYLLAMQLSHKRSTAVISMLAITFDLMHFTQTRIATIDSFPVFFIILTYLLMVRYMQMDSFAVSDVSRPRLMDRAYVKTMLPLLLCGVCMGLSIACKWIGIYSAFGLAALFILTVYRQARVYEVAWETDENACSPAQSSRILAARSFTIHRIAITCGFCVIFFVLIPCLIYAASYIPYLAPTGPVTLKRIIDEQVGMLSYHGTPGLGMDHPFQSPWWQWPFILKPMWFAQDQFEPAGTASTIMCMGNPWVFYIGAAAMLLVLVSCVLRYTRIQDGRLRLRAGNGDLTFVILCIAFLSQYLPWVLVPRSMYIYHYFASVPFIIIATACLLSRLPKERPLLRYGVMGLYIAGAIVFFVMFFPYASGWQTSTAWLDAMKWFSKLYY